MPEEGVPPLRHEDILTYDEIADFTRIAVKCGINKVRITGGEPLVRKNISTLVRMLSLIDGITDLSMTTNGILLDKFALELAQAGLMRVNISLDTTDPQKYSYITRGGKVDDVLRGIEAAQNAGLTPVKINCVIKSKPDEEDAVGVAAYCIRQGIEVRFIRQMDLLNGSFSVVHGGSGGNCARCNRLRLTSDGMLKPCLFNDLGFNIRKIGAKEAIRMALDNKPERGTTNTSNSFSNIGG
jgi:GTP 3',8-cyclase